MERKKVSGALPRAPSPASPFRLPHPTHPSPPLPDWKFLEDVQAAFKRHRPLCTMASSSLRARRVPVQQACTNMAASREPEAAPSPPEDSYLTAPLNSGTTLDGTEPDGKASGLGSSSCQAGALSHAVNGTAPSGDLHEKMSSRKAELDNHGAEGSHSMTRTKAEDRSTIGPGQENMLDMNLLKVCHLDKAAQRQNVQPVDPMTQSSCPTTMSIHSGPTVQSTHAAFSMKSAPTSMAATGLEGVGTAQGHGGMDPASKAYELPDHPKESCGHGVIGRKDGNGDGLGYHLQAHSVKNCTNGDPNPPTKLEKIRKKKYDPDLFFKVNGKLYQRLGKIGSGGSSEVYKVISSDCTIYALKRIKLKGRDYPTAYGFCQEIEYLNKLKGKNNIIELIDYEVTDSTLIEGVQTGTLANKDGKIRDDSFIYMVLEYGEIDLAHMVSQKWMELHNTKLDENWLRFYWQQMLEAVNTIHEERIVHSDLKPANFLLVKGSLKLIDFGIAKAIMTDTTNIQRDAQVGTLNYMSPEAFMWNEKDGSENTIKCGRPSDIWSLGCILYQMVYGKTPFADYKTFWAKFKVITDRNHKIDYAPISNPWLIDLMKKCLAWDRGERWRIPQLLQHPFLQPPMPPLDVTEEP